MAENELKCPNFIGIGAARSGSTWIFKKLEQNPNIWIPRIKELHYFSRSSKYHGPSHLEEFNFLKRMLYRGEPYKKYRNILVRAIGSNIIRPSWNKLTWDIKYLFKNPTHEWYVSLFNQGANKITGEITPQYSVLDIDDIIHLKNLIPKVKILFIMRDPIDRAWSLIKYHDKRNKEGINKRTSLSFNELKILLSHPAILAQSDYRKILRNWRSVFPAKQLFLAHYDEIKVSPESLETKLLNFLNCPIENTEKKNHEIVNPSFQKDMPEDVKSFLIDFYLPQIKILSDEEGGYFTNWLKKYS